MKVTNLEFLNSFIGSSTMDFFTKSFDRVCEFNLVARGIHEYSEEAISRQKSFVEEEINELIEGIDKKSRVEVVDALCDIFVVASYWDFLVELLSCGNIESSRQKTLEALHETKQLIDNNYPFKNYFTDNICKGYDNNCPKSVLIGALAILQSTNIDYHSALDSVLSSNESKLPLVVHFHNDDYNHLTLDDHISKECKDIEIRNNGRYKGVKGEIFNKRVVFRDQNGKIMKPYTFFEPSLEDC